MKKTISILIAIIFITSSVSYAGSFNFGQDTYEKVDNILIVNSLGDEVAESKFNYDGKSLGYNDYIPENAFKNNLYNEGYTKVYDQNNSNLDLVEVGYMGKLGDPRTFDKDYVLRNEWEKYSSQYQDVRIEKNKTEIQNVDNKHTQWNETQDVNINNNKKEIQDNTQFINHVNNTHNSWNNKQDKQIKNNSNRINDIDNRVADLEKTQYIVGGEVRLHDSKKWKVKAFADYTTTRQTFDRVGVRFTYKVGKSYEEKRIDELEAKLNRVLNLQSKEEKQNLQYAEENYNIQPTENGAIITSKF